MAGIPAAQGDVAKVLPNSGKWPRKLAAIQLIEITSFGLGEDLDRVAPRRLGSGPPVIGVIFAPAGRYGAADCGPVGHDHAARQRLNHLQAPQPLVFTAFGGLSWG